MTFGRCASLTSRRGSGFAALLLGLSGCVGQSTQSQTPLSGEGAINAEDVKQVPIQQSGHEKAAEGARHCTSPTGSGVECDVAGINRQELGEGIPNVIRR